ncbi:hypothetical protein HMPREF9225_0109 [Peptoniphilus duerdenii ATCC BAA-1640]|uniref:Uncharacterized protein n=1 Tax=Peptoniphilus duerdenii ATCC BAA-1640 TaxID=862517 RepID=E0NIX0_9FIRM|nr:hypothetical protein HMPREF9225_0109 [Peptoniphilus duerdenii ATCC BAA-1640]
MSDPSTSEPCGSFAQGDQVGRSTLLKDDRSWEVHCSLRLWNLEGSATVVVANVRSSEVIPVRLTSFAQGDDHLITLFHKNSKGRQSP